ncbi:MAG: SGNH/GDSL hydrolase family protein [Alphaproteobacteria bacterium]|nr:SGNH/GDSL hydrolase family protein [Alphaproteobacteria bacterium]MBV9198620.1 SGNH/GDSL hydrolase family protein [Alphaproteobacteria bacterium]
MTATPALTWPALAFAIASASGVPAIADATGVALPGTCEAPRALSAIEAPLYRTSSRIVSGKPVTIVAMGSSSTLGTGASSPASNYPSRLEQELRERFPGIDVRVVNHGVGGQDVPEELTRLGRDVMAEHPDLVIWQVGTNAVLRRDDLSADEQLIGRGVASMQEKGIDIVLMDLQYAPRVLSRPAAGEMERLIADLARRTQVGLFRRFEIMKEWDHTQQLAPATAIGPDGLHMTDASYGCLANRLAEALATNWLSQNKLAKSPQRNPDAVAGVAHATLPAPDLLLPR